MSLIKLMESYKKQMDPIDYKNFTACCMESVDLNAKNTKNRACRNVAEAQIKELAEKLMKHRRSFA